MTKTLKDNVSLKQILVMLKRKIEPELNWGTVILKRHFFAVIQA